MNPRLYLLTTKSATRGWSFSRHVAAPSLEVAVTMWRGVFADKATQYNDLELLLETVTEVAPSVYVYVAPVVKPRRPTFEEMAAAEVDALVEM